MAHMKEGMTTNPGGSNRPKVSDKAKSGKAAVVDLWGSNNKPKPPRSPLRTNTGAGYK